MNRFVAILCASTLVFALLATAQDARNINAEEIASGYAKAFKDMRKLCVNILYRTPDATETIKGVKEITAYGGTLLIRTTSGRKQVLDATRIIKITEE